jgi:NAD+ diphosphatase
MHEQGFTPGVTPPATVAPHEPLWFVVRGTALLVSDGPGARSLPAPDLSAALAAGRATHYLGAFGAVPCVAVEVAADEPAPAGYEWIGLRALYGAIPDALFPVAGRAVQVVDWDRTHRFCGACGAPTVLATDERAKRCSVCGLASFPRLAPAAIVLVERDGAALLAHGVNFPERMYSTLAGFVEPGETLEEAAAREVYEEVGVRIGDIRYFGSQPWPFPHSLMVGFTARWLSGEIEPAAHEIADARWFRPDDLPQLPGKISIARALIDDWLRRSGVAVD